MYIEILVLTLQDQNKQKKNKMSKIKFITGDVLPKVSQVAQVVNQKNTISILENLMLETFNGQFLNITASDGETWLLVSTGVEIIEGDVKCCINAQRLNTALRSLGNDMEVVVEFNEQSHIAKFNYTSGNFELPFLDADEFPNPSNASENNVNVELLNNFLVNGLGFTEFATDTDSLHPQFNGIHVDFIKNEENGKSSMVFVATDTRKLIKYTQDFEDGIDVDELNGKGFTLPKKAAITILQLLANADGNASCMITFNEQNFSLKNENSVLSTRLINGRFPNYNAVIPTDNNKMAIIGKDAIIGALKRVMAFANQKTLMATLTFEDNKIKLETRDIDFNTAAQEIVECNYTDEPITIGFPCNGLIDVVKNVRCDNVAIKMSEPQRAGLIIPSSQPVGTEYVSIQMPMQV